MKKLLILFCLIPFALFGQKTYVRTQVSGTDVIFQRGSDSLNPYIPYANRTTIEDVLFGQDNVFNILNYGAVSDDGIDDHEAIQDAIDAAHAAAVADAEIYGGYTVKIPAGVYNISSADTLKSSISIEIDKNAVFVFPSTYYSGSMWVNPNVTLYDCWVDGGIYVFDDYTGKAIDLTCLTGKAIVRNHFDNMFILRGRVGINLETEGNGWINSNYFHNIQLWNQRRMIKMVQSPTSAGLDANVFSHLMFQASDSTEIGIDTLDGRYNQFSDLMLWDFQSIKTIALAAGSHDNVFSNISIHASGTDKYNDLGVNNLFPGKDTLHLGNRHITTSGTISAPRQIFIGNDTTAATPVNRLIIQHNGSGGSAGSPAGDIAIKLKPEADEGTYPENMSARIVAQDEAASNYSSYLKFQTHGTSQSASYVDAMTLTPDGNVNTGAVNYVADNSGSSNDTYTATVVGTFLYQVGKVIIFNPITANTDGCTLAINGGSAYAIVNQAGSALTTNDMVATGFYPLCWNGTNWTLMTK